MKNKLSKLLKFIAIIFTCLLTIGCIWILTSDDKPTYADAGFDVSYDGGGFYGGYDSDYSGDYGGDYSGGSGSRRTLTSEEIVISVVTILGIAVLTITIYLIFKLIAESIKSAQYKRANMKIENIIKPYIPDFDVNEFLKEQYENYCKIQTAWMEFKLEDVKELLTDELYTMWSSQLKTLEARGEQNIIGGFDCVSCKLKEANVENGQITVTADYVIKAYDFIAKKGATKVNYTIVRGNRRINEIEYIIKFRFSADHMNKVDKCPSCGHQIENNTSSICPFCRSQLFVKHKKWVLTEKTVIKQK